jgi:polyisoprenoid-binding protein YceI
MRSIFAKYALAGALALSVAAGGAVVAQSALTTTPSEVTAGAYDLDASHGKITWSVTHFGLSTYVGQFVDVKAELKLDPANPSASTLTATIPLTSVAPNSDGLKNHLQTPDFFDTANHPNATFVSRSVTVDPSNPNKATVVGDLTLKGVTKPVTIAVTFNGAGEVMGAYKAGFDGEATIKRSDFGVNYAVPAVSDEVKLHIEGEFALKK